MATEKRLIDAMNTVTKISKRVTPQIAQGCHQQRVYAEVLQVIAEAPTVDAVEVVRCKDCVYCSTKRSKRYNQLLRFCEWGEGYTKVDSNGSFFCAHGKRSKYATD